MTEPCLIYKPWHTLDPEKRYCLIDTMALLQIYRRNLRLTAMVDAVRGDRTLLLIPDVVDECFEVFHHNKPDVSLAESTYVSDEGGGVFELFLGPATHEDLTVEPQSRNEFDCMLAESLQDWDVKFVAARPRPDTYDIAKKTHAEKRYKKKGIPLSRVDCLLLCLTIENQSIDVITDDEALLNAVLTECGQGKASHVLANYFGRLNMTAHFLSKILNTGFVDCMPIRDRVEYHAREMLQEKRKKRQTSKSQPCLAPQDRPVYGPNGLEPVSHKSRPRDPPGQEQSMLCALQVSPDGISAEHGKAIRDMKRDDASDAMSGLIKFVSFVMFDWYCVCGDANYAKFDKEWRDAEYGFGKQTVSKTKRYYDAAKEILEKNRERYCACSRPDERQLHEAFKAIMLKDDNVLSQHLFDVQRKMLQDSDSEGEAADRTAG